MTTLLVAGSSRCAASCYDATGPECTCPCGGRNHGVGRERAAAQIPELVDAGGPGVVALLELPLTSAHDGPPAAGASAAVAEPSIECAGPEERRVAPGPLQVAEERPAPHTDGPPVAAAEPAHEEKEDAAVPVEVDLRAPYTPDEWAAIGAALKAERERRSKRGEPFTQTDQVAVIHEVVRPIREALRWP